MIVSIFMLHPSVKPNNYYQLKKLTENFFENLQDRFNKDDI